MCDTSCASVVRTRVVDSLVCRQVFIVRGLIERRILNVRKVLDETCGRVAARFALPAHESATHERLWPRTQNGKRAEQGYQQNTREGAIASGK